MDKERIDEFVSRNDWIGTLILVIVAIILISVLP
jgi:hypothetical protein